MNDIKVNSQGRVQFVISVQNAKTLGTHMGAIHRAVIISTHPQEVVGATAGVGALGSEGRPDSQTQLPLTVGRLSTCLPCSDA